MVDRIFDDCQILSEFFFMCWYYERIQNNTLFKLYLQGLGINELFTTSHLTIKGGREEKSSCLTTEKIEYKSSR